MLNRFLVWLRLRGHLYLYPPGNRNALLNKIKAFRLWWKVTPIAFIYWKIRTWFFLLYNMKKIAVHLDDCIKTLGRADFGSEDHNRKVNISARVRNQLIARSNDTLPNWKWRD